VVEAVRPLLVNDGTVRPEATWLAVEGVKPEVVERKTL
jgi:hypothetical protein